MSSLFSKMNRPENPQSMTDLEKKHLPVITAPDSVKDGECFNVIVEVGKLLTHPNEMEHFIQFVDLYAGEVYLSRMDFTAETTCPTMNVCVSLPAGSGSLRAVARCNKHGVWEGSKDITVE